MKINPATLNKFYRRYYLYKKGKYNVTMLQFNLLSCPTKKQISEMYGPGTYRLMTTFSRTKKNATKDN